MAEPKRKPVEGNDADMGLEGFEQFFDGGQEESRGEAATISGDLVMHAQLERLLERLTELLTFSVDQRVETAKMAAQLVENQRQLIATQQILIRLMERSIEVTRHISSIEEKLPALFEVPRTVEFLRQRVAQLEGIEID